MRRIFAALGSHVLGLCRVSFGDVALPRDWRRVNTAPARRSAAAMRELHVVLVEPEIHWNTGNAGRTCLAVGAQLHLVAPLGFSLDEEVRRAGLDYWPRVAPRVWPELGRLRARAARRWARRSSSSSRGARRFQEVRYPRPAVLVFGRESVGLPPELLARQPRRPSPSPCSTPSCAR